MVLCSSMGGTNPDHILNTIGRETRTDGSTHGGEILRWKRKSEEYLIASGLPYTVVHPGHLTDEPGGARELVCAVDDTEGGAVPRQDLAELLVQALRFEEYKCRSFDLIARPEGEGTPTQNFRALILDSLGYFTNCDYSLGGPKIQSDPSSVPGRAPDCSDERLRRRALGDAVFEAHVAEEDSSGGPSGVEQQWWDLWRDRIDCWWLGTPHQHALQACSGSLGLTLARLFERALSRARAGGAASSIAARSVPSDPGCEWVEGRLGELALPEFPELPRVWADSFEHFERFEWPPIPAAPRLLPNWQELRSSSDGAAIERVAHGGRPQQMSESSGLQNLHQHEQRVVLVMNQAQTLVVGASTGAVASLALLVIFRWKQSGLARVGRFTMRATQPETND